MAFRGRCGLPRGRNLRDDRPEGWSTASCRSTAGLLTRTTHGDLDEVVVEVGIDMEAMWFNVTADNSGAANPSRCATRISGTCTAPAALLAPAPRMPSATTVSSRSAEVVIGSAGSHLPIDAMHVGAAVACTVCSQVIAASRHASTAVRSVCTVFVMRVVYGHCGGHGCQGRCCLGGQRACDVGETWCALNTRCRGAGRAVRRVVYATPGRLE